MVLLREPSASDADLHFEFYNFGDDAKLESMSLLWRKGNKGGGKETKG